MSLRKSSENIQQEIQSENIKFESFIELIFKCRLGSNEIKNQIIKFVQTLETNYNKKILELKE